MPPAGLEAAVEWPQTYAFEGKATGIDRFYFTGD
jgi:hypothetical protein